MKTREKLMFAAVFAALAAGSAPAQERGWSFAMFQTRDERGAERAYQRGSRALDNRQWDQAVQAFAEVPAASSRADAALYWKAYAQNKLAQRSEALASIAELRKSFGSSRWLNDAKALELEIRQASGQGVSPDTVSDEDLKLMAINALMNADPERALPQLEKVLTGTASPKLKERALFVLTQNDSPKAREIVGAMARGQSNPDLQMKAIEYLGLFGGSSSRQALSDIYASSNDARVKSRILKSFMLSGDRDRLLAAAKQEKDAGLRTEAIKQLGLMGARKELGDLYTADSSPESRKAVINALFLSGDSARMGELARNEKDTALRMEAIQKLGLMGSKTAPDLLAIYAADSDKALRKKVINALFLQGNRDAIADLARKEADPDLKREAITKLGLIGGTAEALLGIYSSPGADHSVRKAVLNSLFLQGNAKALVELARKETDPELKKEAVQKLSLMHSKEATDFMMEILK